MENTDSYTLKDVCDEIIAKIPSLGLSPQLQQEMTMKIQQLKESDGKTNLIFLGSTSSGKTTSINLILKLLLMKGEYSIQDLSCPSITDNEIKYFQLVTAKAENTYFFTFIESSETECFKINMKLNDFETEFFKKNKTLNSLIKKENSTHFIEKEFPNTKQGLEDLNNLFNDIDDVSMEIIEEVIKKELNESPDQNNEDRRIPIIKIKVPNFPKEYRLVDTPGVSLQNFARDIKNNLQNNNTFNSFNVYIFIYDICSIKTYNYDYKLLGEANDHGQPIVYSFHTKGNKLIKEYKELIEINEKKQAETDRKKSLRINREFLEQIKDLTNKGVLFRKIIPLTDYKFDNENVKENLDIFMKDLEEQIEKYSKICYQNTTLQKLSQVVMQYNDHVSKTKLISDEELEKMKAENFPLKEEREKKIQEYFEELDTFENYRKKYPNHISQLETKYKDNEKLNTHDWSRSNYIEKHMKDAIGDFKSIILKKPNEINNYYLERYFSSLEKNVQEKVIQRLKDEGLVDKTSTTIDGAFAVLLSTSITSIATAITVQLMIRGGLLISAETLAVYAGVSWIPVVGWSIGIPSLVGTIVYSIHDKLGMWKKENAKEDISKGLFNWFLQNKGDLLNYYLNYFDTIIDKFIENIKDKKEKGEKFAELQKIVEKLKKSEIPPMQFQLNPNDLLELTKDPDLNKFTKDFINLDISDVKGEDQVNNQD